jgi:hypothetical protein
MNRTNFIYILCKEMIVIIVAALRYKILFMKENRTLKIYSVEKRGRLQPGCASNNHFNKDLKNSRHSGRSYLCSWRRNG